MTRDRSNIDAPRATSRHRFTLVLIIAGAFLSTCDVMRIVARHTIDVVGARHLLPRWDLATHLGHGWLDYHLLVTAQLIDNEAELLRPLLAGSLQVEQVR